MQMRYRNRIEPTPAQQAILARVFGCARVVFNDALRERDEAYRAGEKLSDSEILEEAAQQLGASHSQVALAWLLKRSPVMLPIPGTSSVGHLEENTAAAELELSDDLFEALDEAAKQAD